MGHRFLQAVRRFRFPRRSASRPDPAAKILLHIGRNKAGSTTLQDFFLRHRADLAQRNVCYALFGHLKDSVPGVIGFGHQNELARYARANPGQTILISNEFMFAWPRAYTDNMVADLKGLDVRVIAYIRPYGAWVCSSYAQDVRNGESRRDFDAYLDWLWPRISAWPFLEAWAAGLGWDKVEVRSIDGVERVPGGLAGDFLSAIGLRPDFAIDAPPRNRAPHWATTEMLRRLIDRNLEAAWDEPGRAVAEPLRGLMEQCLAERPEFAPTIQYLTQAQADALAILYNRDIAAIARCRGNPIGPPAIPDRAERAFLPGYERIPSEIRHDFFARAQAPRFVSDYPAAAAAATARFGTELL